MSGEADRVIGVLGGMGPEATIVFHAHIVALTQANCDQEHLRVIIDSNPAVPDRTAALLGKGPSPVPLLASGVETLKRAGADFVVIPCVSAHAFLDELKPLASLPILSILDAVAERIGVTEPPVRSVGLLATTGTVRAGLFQRRLVEGGLEVLLPDEEDQGRVMAAIYGIKGGEPREQITRDLHDVAHHLQSRGAQGLVLGCTEIPLVFEPSRSAVPVFDALQILAAAAVRQAGREPRAAGALRGQP